MLGIGGNDAEGAAVNGKSLAFPAQFPGDVALEDIMDFNAGMSVPRDAVCLVVIVESKPPYERESESEAFQVHAVIISNVHWTINEQFSDRI